MHGRANLDLLRNAHSGSPASDSTSFTQVWV
jgi:hypothetical protein